MLTTLRNCLIGLNKESAREIEINNGCMILISLLIQRYSNKQMNYLADCLLRLAMFNTNAQVNNNKIKYRKTKLNFLFLI